MMLLASDSIMLMVFYTKKVQITISYTYMVKARCVWNRLVYQIHNALSTIELVVIWCKLALWSFHVHYIWRKSREGVKRFSQRDKAKMAKTLEK